MTKQEIIEQITEYVNDAPKNTAKIQVILLGGGGWITCNSYELEEDDQNA